MPDQVFINANHLHGTTFNSSTRSTTAPTLEFILVTRLIGNCHLQDDRLSVLEWTEDTAHFLHNNSRYWRREAGACLSASSKCLCANETELTLFWKLTLSFRPTAQTKRSLTNVSTTDRKTSSKVEWNRLWERWGYSEDKKWMSIRI